jgi:hypothetical protein
MKKLWGMLFCWLGFHDMKPYPVSLWVKPIEHDCKQYAMNKGRSAFPTFYRRVTPDVQCRRCGKSGFDNDWMPLL